MMETFHRRAIKLPKGTRKEHLTLRSQAAYGSIKRVVILKDGKEIGHFLLSENTIRTEAVGWVATASAKLGKMWQKLSWMCTLMVVLLRICVSLACVREPAVGDWNALDGLWGCSFGLKTWANWKIIPIFYFLYDWLLGLLEDALSPVERPHSITITTAWQHVLCVAVLGSGIFLVAASRLAWLLLMYCYTGRVSRQAHLPSKHPLHHHMGGNGGMIHADSDPGASHRHMGHADSDPGVSHHHVGHAESASGSPTHAGSDFSVTHHGHVPHADSDPVTPAGPPEGLLKKAGEPGTAASPVALDTSCVAADCAGDIERKPSTPNHSPQNPADASRPPSAAFKELGEKASHEGRSSGGVTSAQARLMGIAAGHCVRFQEQPVSVRPNIPHKSGKHTAPDHVNATPADTPKGHPSPSPHPHNESSTSEMTNLPEDASPLDSPGTSDNAAPTELPETLEDAPSSDLADTPENTAFKARLAEMRKALEEAGVETVSRADAHTVSLQADNKRLRLLLASSLAQLAAAQQGGRHFRRLFLSATGLGKSAFRQAAAERHRAEAALERLHRVQAEADQTASNAAQQKAALTRLKLTAEARVSELTADIKSLHAALEQTALVRDRREAAFVQATKMRSFTEQHLVKTRLQPDALQQALQQCEDREDASSSAVPTGGRALAPTAAVSSAIAEESKTPVHGSTVTQGATAAFEPATASGSVAVQRSPTTGESHLAPTISQGATAETGHATAQGITHGSVTALESTVAQESAPAVESTASTTAHASSTAEDCMIASQQLGAANTATAAEGFPTAGEDCLGPAPGSSTAAGGFSTAASHAAAQASHAPISIAAQESRSRLTESSAIAEDSVDNDKINISADIRAADTTIISNENATSADLHQTINQAQAHNKWQTYPHAQTHDKNQTRSQAQNLSLSESHHVLGSSAALEKTGARTDSQTDQFQIAALHPQVVISLQQLQRELDSKDQVIMQQAADITSHALKATGQKLKMQQLQTQVRARELAWLLFEIRLGFKNGQYDMPYNAKQIAEGGSAQIYLEGLHGEKRATKYPKKGAEAVGDLAHELRMHLRCAGPSTVKILSVGMDKVPRGFMLSADVVCFSMEVASQSLKAYIRQASGGFKGANRDGLVFELAQTKFILRQIVQAMQGVHGHATLHGDVKPDNFLVFLHEGSGKLQSVKITDFGLAADLIEGCHHITPTTAGTRGTQGWIPPEMYAQNLSSEQRKGCNVTAKADVYAAGWVFFEVLCGLSPLLFREAKSNNDFAANAKCFPALDFKVRRQEVSVDGDEDSHHADRSPADSHASDIIELVDHADLAVSGDSLSSAVMSIKTDHGSGAIETDILHRHTDMRDNITEPQRLHTDTGCSTLQLRVEAQCAEDPDMVSVYPEYLLHGVGLQLLRLCMAMWSLDPQARPTWKDVLEQLNGIC
ncbi:TPA: hypothetical protein ACH3X1_008249 [Trebouxia sp. C0004]